MRCDGIPGSVLTLVAIAGAFGGAAVLSDAATGVICVQPDANCQVLGILNAFNSTTGSTPGGSQFVSADDFTPAISASITSVCWHGVLVVTDPKSPPPDDFTVTYFLDDGGLPGAPIASFSQADGSLTNLGVDDTDQTLGTLYPILMYTAVHPEIPVTAGTCYWIEITNQVGDDGSSWFWEQAETVSTLPFFAGNGRTAVDGSPPDGYDNLDLIGAVDLAFCVNLELSRPSCGLQTLFNTGPEEFVSYQGSSFYLGWPSGILCVPDCAGDDRPQKRTAQAFTIPAPVGAPASWRIRQIFVDGFKPANAINELLEFEIFSRAGLERPDEGDSLITGSVPFETAAVGSDHPQGGFDGSLHSIHVDFDLPPGDYWLTVWASGTPQGQTEPSVFAWFSNAPDGINNSCPPTGCVGRAPCGGAGPVTCDPDDCASTAGDPMMWRACHWPPLADGFGFGSLNWAEIQVDPINDPTPDPDDLFNTVFMIRGEPGGPACPWDCGDANGIVGIVDFLTLLGQWTQVGTSCDLGLGGPGVTIEEFLDLLAHWGGCP